MHNLAFKRRLILLATRLTLTLSDRFIFLSSWPSNLSSMCLSPFHFISFKTTLVLLDQRWGFTWDNYAFFRGSLKTFESLKMYLEQMSFFKKEFRINFIIFYWGCFLCICEYWISIYYYVSIPYRLCPLLILSNLL